MQITAVKDVRKVILLTCVSAGPKTGTRKPMYMSPKRCCLTLGCPVRMTASQNFREVRNAVNSCI